MSHAADVLDDELAPAGSSSKRKISRITTGFVAALFAYQAVSGILAFLASGRAQSYTLDGIVVSCGLDLVRVVVLTTIAAWFLREFWRRLVTDVASVRPIDFRESLSIVLMLGLLV